MHLRRVGDLLEVPERLVVFMSLVPEGACMPDRHQKKEEGLREALGLYEKLQRIAETVHGLRNSHIAMAHRAIADVHMMLNEHGAPSVKPPKHTPLSTNASPCNHARTYNHVPQVVQVLWLSKGVCMSPFRFGSSS